MLTSGTSTTQTLPTLNAIDVVSPDTKAAPSKGRVVSPDTHVGVVSPDSRKSVVSPDSSHHSGDSVQLSGSAQTALAVLQEATETAAQTAKEAGTGDVQAQHLLQKETAQKR